MLCVFTSNFPSCFFLITKQICILLTGFFVCDFLGFLLLLKIKVKTYLLSSVSLLINLVF